MREEPRLAGLSLWAGQGSNLRPRVGDYRVMYAFIAEDRVLHDVLGIVHRSELERWLRSC